MPSVYDYHHIELNKVGRGKKRISLESSDGGIKSVLHNSPAPPPTTPTKSNGSPLLDTSNGHSNGGSPNGSRPASRRGSRTEDTKTKLFGPPEESPRRVKQNLFKSTVFSSQSPPASPQKVATPKTGYIPARRNPITGEVLASPAGSPASMSPRPARQSEEKSSNGVVRKSNGCAKMANADNGSIASSSSLSSIPSN